MSPVAALLAYLPAAIIVTLIPGPDTALVLGLATRHGTQAARRAALGIGTGLLVWAAAVAAGLATVLQASADVYEAFRLFCAAYLLYLAAAVLLARRRADRPSRADQTRPDRQPTRPHAAGYRAGLLTATLNPKLGVFFVTMLPQFIPTGAPVAAYTVSMVALQAVCSVAWYFLVARLAQQGQGWLRRDSVQRWLSRCTALVFTVFGLRTAFLDH